MKHFDVTIDEGGWEQDKRRRPPWRPSIRARTDARRDLPWIEQLPAIRRAAGLEKVR